MGIDETNTFQLSFFF